MPSNDRRPVNVSPDARQIAEPQKAQWLTQNKAALASSNAYVERCGLPLAKSRLF